MNLRRFSAFSSVVMLLSLPSSAVAHGIAEADRQAMIAGGNLQYIVLGAGHMLTGYDHLLFLFGVLFLVRSVREVIKYITAFTLGHSLTLLVATIYGVSVNYYLIDAFIALTVCYKGFENLDGFKRYLGRRSPALMPAIFAFGLVHGLGLSTRLQQLPIRGEGLILRILSFNTGVELGQIAGLCVMLLVLAGWRRTNSFVRFSDASNRALIAAGVVLFLVQMHGFGHSVNWSGFGFSAEAQELVSAVPSSEPSAELRKALAAYDTAFEARDVMALWNLFDEHVVLVEQGVQNIGRDEALGKHLGPDLQAFQHLAAQYTNVSVQQANGIAMRTRHFLVRGALPNRMFLAKGFETQNWAVRDGQWRLVHMHWSFPAG